jgi:Polyketide cyclase / dehydrase and lipid transport
MSRVRQAIEISAPLHTVYEQLTTFENYPAFMSGVEQVTPLGDHRTHWIMDVEGKRREFDAEITELAFDKRVSWSTMDGPRLAETLTMRPLDETHTQLVAQLEADIAFLMPSDRHGQETLNRRLKADLTAFKGMVESGKMGGGASSKRLSWDSGTIADATTAPGIGSAADADGLLAPGRRIGGRGPVSGGAAGAAPMGGRMPGKHARAGGMMHEEDRGSAEDM